MAVLRTNIADLAHRNRAVRRQARDWFASDDEGPLSLVDVCDSLELDPGRVRELAERRA